MGKSLSMEYTTMEQEIKNLKKASAAFDTTAQNMSTAVGNLCGAWTADASPIYKADYDKLKKNFDKTRGVVNSLIKSTEDYIADMKALDQAYSTSTVQ